MKPINKELRALMGAHLDISEHLGILKGLACDPNVKTIAEFGFRTGVSATALCASGKPVTSYDVDDCKKHADRLRRIASKFTFVRQNSLEVTLAPCDLLHIDSLHTYQQLRKELHRHHGSVSKWIALHDTVTFGDKGVDGNKPGLMQAVIDFMRLEGNLWRIQLHLQNNNGFTLLQKP